VRVTSSEPCPEVAVVESNIIEVNFPTGITEQKTTGFEIYPNASKGRFTIQGSVDNDEPLAIELINPMGQVVYNRITFPANRIVSIEIVITGSIASGIYLLRIKNSNGSEIVRMVLN
jgi:hypothetical protein